MSQEIDYKAAYEREKLKTADLAGRIAELEDTSSGGFKLLMLPERTVRITASVTSGSA